MIFNRRKNSSLLSKYLELYKKKPTSKVFAPLAETYRKIGLMDEAMEVLRKGLRYHPTYVLGYMVLAQCYSDQGKHDLVYSTLLPFVEGNRDNITIQRLFARSAIEMGELERALETYKFLLFLNPKDEEALAMVAKLEESVQPLMPPESTPLPTRNHFEGDDDQWVTRTFSHKQEAPTPTREQTGKTQIQETPIESWEIKKSQTPTSLPELIKQVQVVDRPLDDDFYSDDPDMASSPQATEDESPHEPMISHTLVDLYIAQGVYLKAKELLEVIVDHYPDDKASLEKLAMVKRKISHPNQDKIDLLQTVEEKVVKPREIKLEKILKTFLAEIQQLSKIKQQQYG